MKTIEEKAKAYDEIIERAKTMLSAGEVMYGKENNASQLITDLIPELRESEDERIMRTIDDVLHLDNNEIRDLLESRNLTYTQVWDYLEKQKEQKPDVDESTKRLNENWMKQYFDEQQEQKPVMSREEILRQLFQNGSITLSDYLYLTEEQKPVEKQDYSGLTDFERAIHRGFLFAGVENVPVTIIKETAQECMAKIKPVEWSEEDERKIRQMVALLKSSKEKCMAAFYKDIDECIAWVCDLRPSWKPSEDQMAVLLNAEGLMRAGDYPESAKILAELYVELKKL